MRRRIWRGWILCLCACLLLCGAASGTGSTPPDAVSRGAFADALYDAHVAHGGAPVVSEGSSAPFRDVGSWSPYFEALCWAKASGIAGGYAGGAFRPAAPVTRQQATVMLYRYAKTTDLPLEKGSDRDLAGYRDADTIPTWSREAVQWAVRNGLWFSGSATELQAAENVSWEELAVLTQRLFLGGMPGGCLVCGAGGADDGAAAMHYHRRGCGTAKCGGGDLLLWGGLRSLSAGERRLVSDEQGNGHHRHCL